MKRIFNIILLALFSASFAQAQEDELLYEDSKDPAPQNVVVRTSSEKVQKDTFEFTYKGQTLKYEVANGNEAKVSKQQSAKISGDVKIPERVKFAGKKYTVTSIGKFAFENCTGLTSVTIPNSVTSIEGDAFYHCTGLTSVTLPNSVTSIGVYAFYECSGLTSITIPNSVTEIGKYAFVDCENLKSINVAKDNLHYCSENGVLFDNTKKRLIQCPCGIKGNYVIPDGVTTIEETAFGVCAGLTSVTIPNSVTTIGRSAFAGCTGLTSVTIPNSVTTIGERAFEECKGLTSVTIPNSVTKIGKSAFYSCTSLTSVTIPNSVTSIGERAFLKCKGVTNVTISNSVTEIGKYAFADCENLKSINVAKDNSHYCSENGVLFDITKKRLIQCPSGIKGNYAIPDGVTSIGVYAFYHCDGLTSVTIPNSVTTIDRRAFKSCTGLTSVTIPNSVTTIGDEAFKSCSSLTILTIENATPPEVRGWAFGGVSENTTIYVPSESVEKYKTAEGWSEYADKIKAKGK